jgi:hypothetical protein
MRSAVTVCIVLFALLVIPVLPASAQLWANNQQMMFEDGNFNHFAAANPQIAQDLMRNPNLVNDPRYLATHPQLVSFMKKYPHAAASLRANPQAFLRHDFRSTTGSNSNSYSSWHQHHHWHY